MIKLRKHLKLRNGTRFKNRQGETVEILGYVEIKNSNHYYEVVNIETGEIKTVQYSNLKSGVFSFKAKYQYNDRKLYHKLRRAYDHIHERISKRKSYANVINKFASFEEFYNFFLLYFEEFPSHREPFLTGKLVIDKDILSYYWMKYGKLKMKEYSKDTILLVTAFENNSAIKQLIKRNDIKEIENFIKTKKRPDVLHTSSL